jgi:hypothetical protein
MSPNLSNRNLWIGIIAVILVIVIAYVLLTNQSEDQINVYSQVDILNDPNNYVDTILAIEGYYYHYTYPEGQGIISPDLISEGQSSSIIPKLLPVNHSAVNLSLADQVKYRFTGFLNIDETSPGESYIFIAEKIEEV